MLFFACPLRVDHWRFSSLAFLFRRIGLFHRYEPHSRVTCGTHPSCGLLYKNLRRVQTACLSASFCFIARKNECLSWTRLTLIAWFFRNTVAGGQSSIRWANQKWNESFVDSLPYWSWCSWIELNVSLVLLNDNWRSRFEFKLASNACSSLDRMKHKNYSVREKSEFDHSLYLLFLFGQIVVSSGASVSNGKSVRSLLDLSLNQLFVRRIIVATIELDHCSSLRSKLGQPSIIKSIPWSPPELSLTQSEYQWWMYSECDSSSIFHSIHRFSLHGSLFESDPRRERKNRSSKIYLQHLRLIFCFSWTRCYS